MKALTEALTSLAPYVELEEAIKQNQTPALATGVIDVQLPHLMAVLGQRLLSPETGLMLSTIILSSGVLYEMVGPACAKASLFLSHTIEKEDAHPVQQEGAAHN